MNYKTKKFMSTQKSQSHKRQEQNNTEWLDELINKIESMKNKINYFIKKPAGLITKVFKILNNGINDRRNN